SYCRRSLNERPSGRPNSDDLAGPHVGGGLVHRVGLAVEVRRGDVVDPLVAVLVVEGAGDTVHVAETLAVLVVEQPRATVGALGHGALECDVLLDLLGLVTDKLLRGLAVAPLRRDAGVVLVAVGVRSGRVAEHPHVLAGRLVPREALAADVVTETARVLGGTLDDREDGLVELRVGAGLDPLLHVVAGDEVVAAAVLPLLAGAAVAVVLPLGHDVGDGLTELRAVPLAGASALVLLLADLFLLHYRTGLVRAHLLGAGAGLHPAGLGRGRVETAGAELLAADLDVLGLLEALVLLELGLGDLLGGAPTELDAVVDGDERVVAVEVLVDVEVVVGEGLLADVDAVGSLALVVARDEDPLVHHVGVGLDVVDAVAGGGDEVTVLRLDRSSRAPLLLALLVDEEHLADGLRHVDVLRLGRGLLLLADRGGRARLGVRAVAALALELGDVRLVPDVRLLGSLQSSAVVLGPELGDGLRRSGVLRHVLAGGDLVGLGRTGQAGGQHAGGQNGTTSGDEDALQGNCSLVCRGPQLASHASVKG